MSPVRGLELGLRIDVRFYNHFTPSGLGSLISYL